MTAYLRFHSCFPIFYVQEVMAYLIHGHISYIFEVNSKKPIREKKKIKRKQSYAEEIE